MLFSPTALSAILLIGLAVVLLLTIRVIFVARQVQILVSEQSLAIQKLSAEIFELQNGHSEMNRVKGKDSQALARIESELQTLGLALTTLRVSSGGSGGESMGQFGKEIKRVLQTKEVNDFLESQTGK